MVHMKDKYSALLDEVVLNGKRIVVTCGIAVSMSIGNLNCGCCKNLYNCGTDPMRDDVDGCRRGKDDGNIDGGIGKNNNTMNNGGSKPLLISAPDYLESHVKDFKNGSYQVHMFGADVYNSDVLSHVNDKDTSGFTNLEKFIYDKTGKGEFGESNDLTEVNDSNLYKYQMYSSKDFNQICNNDKSYGIECIQIHAEFIGQRLDKDAINVVQAASQFNNLESRDDNLRSVIEWSEDRTQGPGICAATYYATKIREMLRFSGILPDDLQLLLQSCGKNVEYFGGEKFYKNGYLKLYNCAMLQELNKLLTEHIDDFKIMIQYATFEQTGIKGFVAFNAAPSYQNGKMKNKKMETEICELIVGKEYEIIALFAKELATKYPDRKVNLYLTEIGRGAFSNPASVYEMGLIKVDEVLKGVPNVTIVKMNYLHDKIRDDEYQCLKNREDRD